MKTPAGSLVCMIRKLTPLVLLTIAGITGAAGQAVLLFHNLVDCYPYKMMSNRRGMRSDCCGSFPSQQAVGIRFLKAAIQLSLFVKGIHAMRKFTAILPLMLFLFCAGAFPPPDGFSGVRCGADVREALIGRSMSNERTAAIENRHKDLGLKDLGGSDISDRPVLFAASWKICGDEYMLLEDGHSVVRDVLKVPEHSKKSPQFIGECQNNGKKMPGTIVAILNNEQGKATLSAKAAWKIDGKTAKFIKISTDGLGCPRDGIITADGGQ